MASREEQISAQKQIFNALDKNRDGTISARELGEALKKTGHPHTDEEVKQMIQEEDIDGDGSIDFKEFQNLLAKMKVRKVFEDFDTNGDGFLTKDEIRTAMKGTQMSQAQIDALINDADLDGDGKINYKEFLRVMKGL